MRLRKPPGHRWIYSLAEPAALEALTANNIPWEAGMVWVWSWRRLWLTRQLGVAVRWPRGLQAVKMGDAIVTQLPDKRIIAHGADNLLTLYDPDGRTVVLHDPAKSGITPFEEL